MGMSGDLTAESGWTPFVGDWVGWSTRCVAVSVTAGWVGLADGVIVAGEIVGVCEAGGAT